MFVQRPGPDTIPQVLNIRTNGRVACKLQSASPATQRRRPTRIAEEPLGIWRQVSRSLVISLDITPLGGS